MFAASWSYATRLKKAGYICLGVLAMGVSPSAERFCGSLPPTDLTGTKWAASYYHYHEDWYFVSPDSVEVCSGQWGWSMPVDPTLISQDSLYIGCGGRHAYQQKDSLLIVHALFEAGVADTFTWRGDAFVSNWTYTNGHVVLMPWPDMNCRWHDPPEKLLREQ